MTEVKKDTYVLTIENDSDSTMITSVQKNQENPQNLQINLENDTASDDLKHAIYPDAPTETVNNELLPPPSLQENQQEKPSLQENQQEQLPIPPSLQENKQEQLPPPPEVPNLDIIIKNKKGQINFQDKVSTLLKQIPDSKTIKDKERLTNYITDVINRTDIMDNRKNDLIQNYLKNTNAGFKDNKLQGGNHHTRKNVRKLRSIKSNTRKGHIYRTNRRRTHGKSSAHGKKQTRRIVNQ
jgi:hypothetical protein